MSRTSRDRYNRTGDKRERILAAALKVFAREGFYNAKVSEIAREAGVADGTIYLYFRNKDDLLISTFEDRMGWLITRLEKELASVQDDPLSCLRRYIRLHLTVALEDHNLAEFITVELRQSSKFIKEYKNTKFTQYLGIVRDIFILGQEHGQLDSKLDPRLATRVFFGALDEVMRALVLGRKNVSEADVEYQALQVERILLQGICTPATLSTLQPLPETPVRS